MINSLTLAETQSTYRRRATLFARAGVVLYAVAILGFWALLRFGGDRWWPATLLLFGPRWLCLVPMVVLVPLALATQRALLLPIAVSALVALFPILGLQVHLPLPTSAPVAPLLVFTYNVGVHAVPPAALSAELQELQPDVVALQEYRGEDYQSVFAGWHVCRQGELLLAARFPVRVRRVESSHRPMHRWPRATLLECVGDYQGREVAFCTVHLPSPRYGLTRVVDKRTIIAPSRSDLLLTETANRDAVSSLVAQIVADGPPDCLILGDFNMPTDSTLYRRDWAGYVNAFSSAGWGLGHTMRAGHRGFGFGVRIDQVLTRGNWAPVRCWVGPDLGSDHLPLIAELEWTGPRSPSAPPPEKQSDPPDSPAVTHGPLPSKPRSPRTRTFARQFSPEHPIDQLGTSG